MSTTDNRLSAAQRATITAQLIAAILWQESFAASGDTQAAQNELDYARQLAHGLDDDQGARS